MNLDIRTRREPIESDLYQLVLLRLDDERESCVVSQDVVIEAGDECPRRLIPKVDVAGDHSDAEKVVHDAQRLDHLERRGMEGRRPRAGVHVRVLLENSHAEISTDRLERCDGADRTGADHDKVGLPARHVEFVFGGVLAGCGATFFPSDVPETSESIDS